jgi:helicase required for RNAi-mediated heterochromatin assembly 1
VHICSIVTSTRGIAVRVTFSLFRAGKQILWEQSKRLVTGSLVVLTPATDKFRTKAIVATVAARPLEGLRQNPPEIDLFFARAEELEIDPAQEFWMVEHRGSMYEADRHTLLALQRMMREL